MERRLALPLLTLVLVATVAPLAAAAPAAVPLTGTVVSGVGVNVRACPRLDCAVRYAVDLGSTLTVTGPAEGGWLPVERNGQVGWAWWLYVAVPGAPVPELRQGEPGCRRVAFLFNIGVGDETRLEPLEWLASQDIPATLFPMGWWAAENREALRQMAALGFPIGSHGNQRQELTGLGDAAGRADVEAAAAAIEAALGEPVQPLFTPSAAATGERVRSLVARAGSLNVGWNVSAADWDFGVTADDVFMNVVPNVGDGSIVEFHLDAPTSAESTTVALPWIVENLAEKGYRFVTVDEMAEPCPAAAG